MKLLIQWDAVPSLELPLNYNQILQGIIYCNLQNKYGLSDFVHEEGYSFGKRSFRMFCFGRLMGKSIVKEKRIRFLSEVSWEIRSPEVSMIRMLADSLEQKGLRFGQAWYKDVRIFLSDEEVEEDNLTVRALSPIVVYKTDPAEKKTYYLHPSDTEFTRMLNDNFQRKYMAYYGMPASEDIEVIPIDVGERDKCVTRYKETYITGYHGIYQLRGKRQYLNFIYQAGLGSKNAQGFGMIELY